MLTNGYGAIIDLFLYNYLWLVGCVEVWVKLLTQVQSVWEVYMYNKGKGNNATWNM